MILSGQTIRDYCFEHGMLEPFAERTVYRGMSYGLSIAGYDVRIAENIRLHPGNFVLASTIEHFNMPQNVLARVADKSTWARRGLAVQNTVIEPGWRGWLTLELTNHGKDILTLEDGMPIAQIIFEFLDKPAEKTYTGKYQDQQSGPQPARYENE